MAREPLAIEQILTMLERAPLLISEYTAGMSSEMLHASPEPGAWSINENLAHLRGSADVWGKHIEDILTQDHPSIRAISPRGWVERAGYRGVDFHESLAAFSAQRMSLLANLRSRSPADWNRSASVTKSGRRFEHTVQGYAEDLARHEEAHLQQIEQAARILLPPDEARSR